MDDCFRIVNEHSNEQYIKLTREVWQSCWLSYLNILVKMSNGMASVN